MDLCKDGCNSGRVVVYQGNYGGGPALVPHQLRSDDSAPIAVQGKSDVTSAFRIHAQPCNANGRSDVRLQWEVVQQGTAFDVAQSTTSGVVLDTGPVGTQ